MDQELYKIAAASARRANHDALKVLGGMWDNILKCVSNADEGICGECDKTADEDGYCPECEREVETFALAALDPLSIEDDGRIILGFGGPNIWISADDKICGAWWDSTISCYAPTAEHENAIEVIREQIGELDG